ncbi:MAG: hypothetical protein U1G05_19925 [Kiritimatiellia bacterium]
MPEHGLHQSQTQSQTMVLAPQLRQGLEVLQATMLELQGIIEQEIQANPVLEEVPKETERLEVEPGAMASEAEPVRDERAPLDFSKEDFAALAKLDEDWNDAERAPSARQGDPEEAETRHQFLMDSLTQSRSLQDHLMDQLGYIELTPAERQLAELIVGSVNEKGYLGGSLEEISANTGVDLRTLERILARVQSFDPAGVAARDLKECLLIQLRRQGRGESLAAEIVSGHLADLGARRHGLIAKALKVDLEDVAEAAEEIAVRWNPCPAGNSKPPRPPSSLPEVAIERIDGEPGAGSRRAPAAPAHQQPLPQPDDGREDLSGGPALHPGKGQGGRNPHQEHQPAPEHHPAHRRGNPRRAARVHAGGRAAPAHHGRGGRKDRRARDHRQPPSPTSSSTPRRALRTQVFLHPRLRQDRRRPGSLQQEHQGRHPAARRRRDRAIRPRTRPWSTNSRTARSPAGPSQSIAKN